ncbi:flagellar biosynthetic protein FliO [Polymorphobacter sp. PAMC 29334]|uniref:FliO/MopB family protein n=1 Tax=Polymorphobacter sp. PAMC 29334 TaxID=2862331 RepID=UPI001C686075|nr:flagellar biosynthetic protein FliO [Polymorphobacter sp. PAMC 29334]QYE34425.1 flagellar biosynthetic protein FliO [Polymorphobacter sp. PAMC 29334]
MTATDYLTRLAVALPLVIAVLAGLWYAAKRGWIQPPGIAPSPLLRPIATLGLGPGSRLVVIEFDGRRLLIAASRSGVTLLDHSAR